MAKYRKAHLKKLVSVAKALSDESRVRALYALRSGEPCVCRIIALLELAPSTVSKHMSILKYAGLVESRKRGRWVNYRLTERSESPEIRGALEGIFAYLKDDDLLKRDAGLLKKIMKLDPEMLCRRQCGR